MMVQDISFVPERLQFQLFDAREGRFGFRLFPKQAERFRQLKGNCRFIGLQGSRAFEQWNRVAGATPLEGYAAQIKQRPPELGRHLVERVTHAIGVERPKSRRGCGAFFDMTSHG